MDLTEDVMISSPLSFVFMSYNSMATTHFQVLQVLCTSQTKGRISASFNDTDGTCGWLSPLSI